jgi:hypothetical protein
MPAPSGLAPELAVYLQDLEDRLSRTETPQGFAPVFLTTTASLTLASAAEFARRWAIATDLKAVVWSDGAHWYRADTGAQIV